MGGSGPAQRDTYDERDTFDVSESQSAARRLAQLVPGGSHTYAKGPDQYPELSPGVLVRGKGSHVWDVDGNEYIEYGMGLRSVTLGHAYPDVNQAVRAAIGDGTNFTRPSLLELELAEVFSSLVEGAEMVKFTKDGSTATTAALKLARKATGRDLVGICADSPFFSYDDWFMCTTTADGGIPVDVRAQTVSFDFNDLASVERMFAEHPAAIAAVFVEASRTAPPEPGFLRGLRDLCDAHGAVLVFDEMITGFRYGFPGAQTLYGVRPHLSTWGKAVANGFALSILSGDRDLMRLGSRARESDDVFLLSTTHGAESVGLAAGLATIEVFRREPVVDHLARQGRALSDGLAELAARHGLAEHVMPVGVPCNLMFATLDPDGRPSQSYRTLFLQETIRRGVLMPSLVVSYAHIDQDIADTLDAIDGALEIYSRALEDGVDGFLVGPPSRYVFDRKWG